MLHALNCGIIIRNIVWGDSLMSDSRPIGVFDSGLGGLTVVKELCNYLPNEDIIYFGDTGRVPYGPRSRETIRKYALQDELFLLKHNVKLIVAACGTVSSVAADTGDTLPVPFFEVVSHASKQAASTTKNGRVGVIGTAATVNSGKHSEIIKSFLPDAQVLAVPCPLFVPLVENGWYDENDIVVRETVKRYLEPIKEFKADTLILGCTHYPILSKVIGGYLGDNVALINSGTTVSKSVAEYLKNTGSLNDSGIPGIHKFYVTDKPDSFKAQVSVLLGEDVDDSKVLQVDLNSL